MALEEAQSIEVPAAVVAAVAASAAVATGRRATSPRGPEAGVEGLC